VHLAPRLPPASSSPPFPREYLPPPPSPGLYSPRSLAPDPPSLNPSPIRRRQQVNSASRSRLWPPMPTTTTMTTMTTMTTRIQMHFRARCYSAARIKRSARESRMHRCRYNGAQDRVRQSSAQSLRGCPASAIARYSDDIEHPLGSARRALMNRDLFS